MDIPISWQMAQEGGILLGWHTSYVEAANLNLKEFSLTMDIKIKCTGSTFLLTTVYGSSEDELKSRFLEELTALKPAVAFPWVVIGALNMIYEARDKSNSNLNHRLMGQFWGNAGHVWALWIGLVELSLHLE
jgi:hypothetical protein